MNGLTRHQADCLTAIRRLTSADGVAPSYEELRIDLGLASKSGVHRLVAGLVDRGAIASMPGMGRDRALSLVGDGPTLNEQVNAHIAGLSAVQLREMLARLAGICAHREGGYAPETVKALRNIADRLEAKPRVRAA